MSRRERQAAGSGASPRRAVIATLILSVVAMLISVGALAVVLTRGTNTAQTGGADPNACRTAAWGAVPSVTALPPGWAIASTRFFVDNLSTQLVGPVPSGSTEGTAAFVSVSCYGSDAALALARSHEAALAAGATDISFPRLGDESLAITSSLTGSTIAYIRRGVLVADVTAPTSLDPTAFQAIAGAVDAAMIQALSPSPGPSAAGASSSAGASTLALPEPTATGDPASAPSASPSAAIVSHVAPDLEALMPLTVEGASFVSQSVTGTTALQSDVTSQSLIASLKNLGKTPDDLQIAEAHDAAGKLPLRLFGFRVNGVPTSDLASAIVESWMANTTLTPKRSDVTIAGHRLTKVAFAQGADYVYETTGVVFDIETTDDSLVSKVLPLLE
jgi:hypothetical protein